MENEISNIETAESERLLSGNVVKPHIYGAKEPVCVNIVILNMWKIFTVFLAFSTIIMFAKKFLRIPVMFLRKKDLVDVFVPKM